MSRNELIDAYVTGAINRRAFVQGLTALGITIGVAASYAVALQPTAAHRKEKCFYDEGFYYICKKRKKKKKKKKKDNKDGKDEKNDTRR